VPRKTKARTDRDAELRRLAGKLAERLFPNDDSGWNVTQARRILLAGLRELAPEWMRRAASSATTSSTAPTSGAAAMSSAAWWRSRNER
jgi:hypothetical protein